MFDVFLILTLSFIPMWFYAIIFWWFDRYEKEPFPLLVAAFAWGAIPSIILALILQIVLDIPITALSSNQLAYDLLGASVAAPVTEEGLKAMALIILLVFLRREIDSPMDGMIYGSLVGFGFAAVENMFYLIGAYADGGMLDVVSLAFLRAGVFGLNHAMYTSFTGLGVALSLEVRNKLTRPVLVFAGFTLSVSAHAIHNALAILSAYQGLLPFLLAILADWGGVFVLLLVAIWSFFLERRRIVAYSQALVKLHAIPAREVQILKSTRRRHWAQFKKLVTGKLKLWRETGHYYHKVTEAAFAWHRLTHGDEHARKRLRRLEKGFLKLRRDLVPDGDTAVE